MDRGNRVCGVVGEELMLRVGPEGYEDALAQAHARPMDFTGRALKGMVYVGTAGFEADKDLARDMRRRGLLFHQEQCVHEYPFCWRAEEDPLIQYPRRGWFIRTTAIKQAMLANNRQVNWLPEHIRDGRFGNFLESNVDWALSRERY